MALIPYKFLVTAIVQETSPEGTVLRERILDGGGNPVEVFGLDGLRGFADTFGGELARVELDEEDL